MSFPSAFRSHVEQTRKALESETILIGHPYYKWKMDVALVGEWVVFRQWEVGERGGRERGSGRRFAKRRPSIFLVIIR